MNATVDEQRKKYPDVKICESADCKLNQREHEVFCDKCGYFKTDEIPCNCKAFVLK